MTTARGADRDIAPGDADVRALVGALLADSREAIVVVDERGDIRLVTRGVAALLGHDPDAAIGSSVFDFLHPDDVDGAADLFLQRLGYDGRDAGKELRVRDSNGDWVELTATVSLLPNFAAAAITLRSDLHGSRERSLQRRIAVAELANQLGADLMSATDSTAVLDRIRRSLGEVGLLTGAEIVAVYLERQERDVLELFAGWRSPRGGSDAPIEMVHDDATVERLLTEHVVADDLGADRHGDLATMTSPLQATGLLAAPFTTGSKRGTVVLLRTRPGIGWWDSDSELARAVANLYGRALHTAWSEQLLALTYREGPVAFSIRTWDGTLVDCNRRYLDLLRITREQAAPRPIASFLESASARHCGPHWRDLRNGAVDRLDQEFEATRGDGSRIWLHGHSVRLQVPGSPEQFVLTAIEDVTESRRQRIELEYAASHDPLTGTANRVAMCDRIEEIATETGHLPTLLMVDLDRFKLVNDGHGHVVGDAVLTTVARRLAQQVRQEDLVARLGGDEFAVVVPDLDGAAATDLADRIRRSMHAPLAIEGRQITQTVSVGIALGTTAASLRDLLVRADRALYGAKHQGRNRHVLFGDGMQDEVMDRLATERDLRRAIDTDQLDVHFQPEVDLATRRVAAVEALVRWEHPERGVIPARDFVPVAEESGLIDEIGRLVLRRATALFTDVCEHVGRSDLVLRVNVSASELSRPELPDLVVAALEDAGLAADRLCLEVAETTLSRVPHGTVDSLDRLRRLGVRFAIDRFEPDGPSWESVARFQVDTIKIDRRLVHALGDDLDGDDRGGDRLTVLRAIVERAACRSIETVAEGVETEAQLAALSSIGFDRAQGFVLARPLPASQLAELIGGS